MLALFNFVHFASTETEDGVNPLNNSSVFKAFQEGIRDRSEVPPEPVPVKEIRSYKIVEK